MIAARLARGGRCRPRSQPAPLRIASAGSSTSSAPPGRTREIDGVAADVSTAAGAEAVSAALPHVDILVNNLGIFEPEPVLEIDDDTWRRYWEVNVLSGVRLARRYLPGMRERGWGRVMFMASDSAVVIPEEMVHYGATKTALLGVSRGYAKAMAGTGVTVNAVIAGPLTPRASRRSPAASSATTSRGTRPRSSSCAATARSRSSSG